MPDTITDTRVEKLVAYYAEPLTPSALPALHRECAGFIREAEAAGLIVLDRATQSPAQKILAEVASELVFALSKFPPYNSAHEGYAVILEELDELWEEIKSNKTPGHEARQRKEALQVATTAVRFILDLRS